MARQRNNAATYARRNERARSDYGLTGYAQLRKLGGRTGLERDFPLSERSRQLIIERGGPTAVRNAHTAYIRDRIKLARREATQGTASPLQQTIADSFSRRLIRTEYTDYGQPLPPPGFRDAVRETYDWYKDWWGEYDPWTDLEDYDTP